MAPRLRQAGRAERDYGGPATCASDELPPHLLAASMQVSVRPRAPAAARMCAPGRVVAVL